MKLEGKYLVLKKADLDLALTREQKIQLSQICFDVATYRDSQHKPQNNYVVINQDEPYFPAVLKLMEEAEQATAKAEDTARRRSQGAKDGWEIRRAKQEGSAS